MPFISDITVTRDAAGGADYTATNPPLPTLSSNGGLAIVWGDTAITTHAGGNFRTYQTKVKIVVPTDMFAIFCPKILNDEKMAANFNHWRSGTHDVIINIFNNSASNGSVVAGQKLGDVFFLKSILDNRKIKFTFS